MKKNISIAIVTLLLAICSTSCEDFNLNNS